MASHVGLQADGAEVATLGLAEVALGGWVLGLALRLDLLRAGSPLHGYAAAVAAGLAAGLALGLHAAPGAAAAGQAPPVLVGVPLCTLAPLALLAWLDDSDR